jgi:hypothetical protein
LTWTIDENQINGEPYTMGGTPVRLERVVSPVERKIEKGEQPPPAEGPVKESGGSRKVVSLSDRKKK